MNFDVAIVGGSFAGVSGSSDAFELQPGRIAVIATGALAGTGVHASPFLSHA